MREIIDNIITGDSSRSDMSTDERMRSSIANQIRLLQSQSEGIYRSLFQACTQNDLAPRVEFYRTVLTRGDELLAQIESLIKQYEAVGSGVVRTAN